MLPGAPIPTPSSPRGVSPADAAASRTARAISSATAPGPPRVGVSRRAAADDPCPAVADDDRLDLRTPEIDAAFNRAAARPRRGACGSLGRSTPRRSAPRCPAPARGGRTRARSRPPRPPRARGPRGAARRPRCRSGRTTTPSFQAASSMFCAARPASKRTGPLPETTIATTSAAPWMLPGSNTVSEMRSRRSRAVGTTNVHGWRLPAEPDRRPASRIRVTRRLGQRVGAVATRVAPTRDGEVRVHGSSLEAMRTHDDPRERQPPPVAQAASSAADAVKPSRRRSPTSTRRGSRLLARRLRSASSAHVDGPLDRGSEPARPAR